MHPGIASKRSFSAKMYLLNILFPTAWFMEGVGFGKEVPSAGFTSAPYELWCIRRPGKEAFDNGDLVLLCCHLNVLLSCSLFDYHCTTTSQRASPLFLKGLFLQIQSQLTMFTLRLTKYIAMYPLELDLYSLLAPPQVPDPQALLLSRNLLLC